jgi:hypothetical protein
LFFGLSGKFVNCKYTGEWKDNKMHGIGKFVWSDGGYYEGSWEFNKQEGEGIFVFKNGEIFKGYWKGGICEELMEKMGKENYLKL